MYKIASINGFSKYLKFMIEQDASYIFLNAGQFMIILVYCMGLFIQYGTDIIRDDRSFRSFPSIEVFCHIYHNILIMIMIERLKFIIRPSNVLIVSNKWEFTESSISSRRSENSKKRTKKKVLKNSKQLDNISH